VLDLVCHLRALANPLDEEALFTVLASPLVGASDDALVLLAAAARAAGQDPWRALRSGALGEVEGFDAGERELLERFASWFAGERLAAARVGIEELIERALTWSGYDLVMLAMPGGERRLANVRKLMRLAREHQQSAGRDLQGFAELLRGRGDAGDGDTRCASVPAAASRCASRGPAPGDASRLWTTTRSAPSRPRAMHVRSGGCSSSR
jgi:ATP-dependent exoDNAse (exonuclease V) beta subunit